MEATPRAGVWTPAGLATAGGMVASAGVALHWMGRRPWCACGSPVPWSWDIWSSHNSQHLVDPYAFTHFLHGLIFYAALRWLLRGRWPLARVLLALALELAWEVGENTDLVINAYRESTISLNYYGDSLLMNVVMLLYPIEALKAWQLAGAPA